MHPKYRLKIVRDGLGYTWQITWDRIVVIRPSEQSGRSFATRRQCEAAVRRMFGPIKSEG